ncbi:MAG: LpxL/LpxP family Kdo(2)-lipid IV(A) lauroyl/palmitoleoyl acyltransferase [Pseudomonadales bacterium]
MSNSLLQAEFLKPKYWLLWFGILWFWLGCMLPLRARWAIGAGLGWLGYRLAKRRRHVVAVNLSLCFPDLDKPALEALVKENFKSSGISLMETAVAWFRQTSDFESVVDFHGMEHMETARRQGRGVLLVGMHLSTLDFAGAMLATQFPFDVVYRRNKNRLLETLMTRGRQRHFPFAIKRERARDIIRRLREGAVVWYAPDQDYGRKVSVFAPFFGVDCATVTATARIAEMCGCPVLVCSHYRNLKTGRYDICVSAPLEGFPGQDPVLAATLINQHTEAAVRRAPEQYWLLHRRFKTRPEGQAGFYDT